MSAATVSPARFGDARPVLITGGAGFVGANLAHRLLAERRPVAILDNLSRPGVERNLAWLREQHPDTLEVTIAGAQPVRLDAMDALQIDAPSRLPCIVAGHGTAIAVGLCCFET